MYPKAKDKERDPKTPKENDLQIIITNLTPFPLKLTRGVLEHGKQLQKTPNILEPQATNKIFVSASKGKEMKILQQWSSEVVVVVVSIIFSKNSKKASSSVKSKEEERFTVKEVAQWDKIPPTMQFTIVDNNAADSGSDDSGAANSKKEIKEEKQASFSGDWSEEENKQLKFDIVIKDSPNIIPNIPNTSQPNFNPRGTTTDELQRALEESKAESRLALEKEKALREEEEKQLQLAMQMSMTDSGHDLPSSSNRKNVTEETTSTNDPKQLATKHFQDALAYFDQGRFINTVPEIQKAIAILVRQPNGHQSYQQEILFSAWYYQAVHFLIELQRLQSLALFEQMGLVSKFLCDFPIQLQHRLVLVRIALKINFQLGNFETAGRLMQMMAAIPGLPETEILKKMFAKCEEEKFVEHCVPLQPSPKICYKTLRLILTDTFDGCDFCGASFRQTPGSTGVQNCAFCNYTLKPQSIVALIQAQAAAAQAAAQAAALAGGGPTEGTGGVH